MAWRKARILDIIVYLTFVGVALRGLNDYSGGAFQWVVAALLLIFLLLRVSEPWFSRRLEWYPYIYLIAQTCLVLVLSLLPPYVDYFVLLFIPLSVDAMLILPRRTAFVWIGILILATGGVLLYTFGWPYTLPLFLIFAAAYLFFASYAVITRRAEEAREESQVLLTQLQAAHRELQAYAAQVEELTAVEERNRLARELHDSVTQTIFSLTLTAQAARILLDQDVAKTAQQLDRVQELAQDALAEMRSLIQELRPKSVVEQGLVPSLRQHIDQRKNQDRLNVVLHVNGEQRLPIEAEEALFRIVQEALNNVVKHARTDQVELTLCWEDEQFWLRVEDDGVGFDPARSSSGVSHLGLTSMRERVKGLGGTLEIESQPGVGTRVEVRVPLVRAEA